MWKRGSKMVLAISSLLVIVPCFMSLLSCGGGSLEERSLDAYEKEQQSKYEERLADLRRNATPQFKAIFGDAPDRVEVVEKLNEVIVYVYKDGAIFLFDRTAKSGEYDYWFTLVWHPQYGYIDYLPNSLLKIDSLGEYGEVLYYLSRQ